MADKTRSTRAVIQLLDPKGVEINPKPYIAESYSDANKAYNQALLDAYNKDLEDYSIKIDFNHTVIS